MEWICVTISDLAATVLLFAVNSAFAAKPHYEITGNVVAIADRDTLTLLDGSNEQHLQSPSFGRIVVARASLSQECIRHFRTTDSALREFPPRSRVLN
jgi:hypothetical protein